MKPNEPFYHLFFPKNWIILLKQISFAFMNFFKYGKFSLDKNSPEYFNKVYRQENYKHEPVHYYYILKYIPSNKNITICDFGCGTGEGMKYLKDNLPNIAIDGIDYSKVAIQKASSLLPESKFFHLDIMQEDIPYKYDYIICIETLEHFRNPFIIINKLLENTNNKLLISVPYTENKDLVGKINLAGKHLFNFNENSLKNISNSKVLEITGFIPTTKSRCIIYEISK